MTWLRIPEYSDNIVVNSQVTKNLLSARLLEIVLTMNNFEFINVCYQQPQRCAMGLKLSPAYIFSCFVFSLFMAKNIVHTTKLSYLIINNNIVRVI